MGERLGHGHPLGIAAVGVAAGRPELVAEVLFAPPAEFAGPARREDPGDADPVAEPEAARPRAQGLDPPDDLMAEDDRQARRRRPPLDLVQLGVADAAGVYLDQQLALGRDRIGKIGQLQRRRIVRQRTEGIQHHGSHLAQPPFRDDSIETTHQARVHPSRSLRLLDRPRVSPWFQVNQVVTGILQTAPGLTRIRRAVDHHKRTTPVSAGQGLGRPINRRMTVRNVDFRPNPLFCGIFRGNGTQS